MTELAKPHGAITRLLHWLTGGMLLFGFASGLDDVSELSDPDVFVSEVWFALIVGFAFAVRLTWTRCVAGATRLPASAPLWEHKASRGVHGALYLGVFSIVLTGLLVAWSYNSSLFGDQIQEVLVSMHEAAVSLTALLLIVHVAAAFWHKFVRRDGIMESMTGRFGWIETWFSAENRPKVH